MPAAIVDTQGPGIAIRPRPVRQPSSRIIVLEQPGPAHDVVRYASLWAKYYLFRPHDFAGLAGRHTLEAQMRILAVIGALTIIIGIGAAVYFFAGFYSVAGTTEDPAIVNWALVQVRTASINRHAQDQPPPPASINDPGSVQAGAKAFA